MVENFTFTEELTLLDEIGTDAHILNVSSLTITNSCALVNKKGIDSHGEFEITGIVCEYIGLYKTYLDLTKKLQFSYYGSLGNGTIDFKLFKNVKGNMVEIGKHSVRLAAKMFYLIKKKDMDQPTEIVFELNNNNYFGIINHGKRNNIIFAKKKDDGCYRVYMYDIDSGNRIYENCTIDEDNLTYRFSQ